MTPILGNDMILVEIQVNTKLGGELVKRKIILASHGNLSNGLLDTAKMIIGNIPYEVETYSLVPGKLAEDYANELKIEIDANLDTEYIILTVYMVLVSLRLCMLWLNAKMLDCFQV